MELELWGHINTVITGCHDWHGTDVYTVHGDRERSSSHLLGRENCIEDSLLSRDCHAIVSLPGARWARVARALVTAWMIAWWPKKASIGSGGCVSFMGGVEVGGVVGVKIKGVLLCPALFELYLEGLGALKIGTERG